MIIEPWEKECDINMSFKDRYSAVSLKCYHCDLILLLEVWNFDCQVYPTSSQAFLSLLLHLENTFHAQITSVLVLPIVCLGLFCSNAISLA